MDVRKGVNGRNRSEDLESAEATETNKNNARGGRVGRREMARTLQTIDRNYLKKIVKQYYTELKDYQEVANYELGLRAAFQNMLSAVAKYCGWSLAPEMTIDKIRPDGVILDEFRIRRGYWEAKGPKVNLDEEIRKEKIHQTVLHTYEFISISCKIMLIRLHLKLFLFRPC
jgi:hypothetical protein